MMNILNGGAHPHNTVVVPALTDKYWYPVYEKMVELDVPAMVHVSSSCNPVFHATGVHYINADTTAFMQFIQGDPFKNVYFDTCVYLPGIELLLKVGPVDNSLFGSEMVGAVRGIDPRTGQHYDDTKKYLDVSLLSEANASRTGG